MHSWSAVLVFSSSIPQHCIWRSEWSFWPWLCQGLLLLQAFESFFRHRQSSSPCFLATTAGPVEVGNCFHFPTANRFACHRLPTFDAASGWRKTLLNSQVLFQTMSGREENFFGMQFCIRPRRDFQHHCCHSAIKTLPTLTKWRYLRLLLLTATVLESLVCRLLLYMFLLLLPVRNLTKTFDCQNLYSWLSMLVIKSNKVVRNKASHIKCKT